MDSYKYKTYYLIHTLLIIFVLKIFTEIIRLLSNNLRGLDYIVKKIGTLDGIFKQGAVEWYPQLDNFLNLIILILFFIFLINLEKFKKKSILNKKIIIITTILSSFIFSSNILMNDYRGWDLFLYCELNPAYVGENPYLNNINGLTAVYSPLIWNLIHSFCKVTFFNSFVFSYFIWIYTGISFFCISGIRKSSPNVENICINLSIVLSFLGSNYSGLKTGNIGYIIGILIAFFFTSSVRNPDSKFISFILGLLFLFKPFFIFWFGLVYLFNKVFRNGFSIFNNFGILVLTQIIGNLLNFIFYRVEYRYFLENILQLNNSVNKPLSDKAGFLNLIFQEYIYRIFQKTVQIDVNKTFIFLFCVVMVYLLKNYFKSINQIAILPIFLTPRFKSYDLTFLYLLFNKKNIYLEFLLFCHIYVLLFIIFSFTGAGYLTEISYVLIFIVYIVLNSRQNKD